MANNTFWGTTNNMDSYSNFHQQQTESPQQNDEWSCSTDDWNYIEQSTNKKNYNNWFDKSENQHEQISSLQHNVNNQEFEIKKCDNNIETDENFWVDVENREILPPESFQNDSLQATMNNLQISNEMINSNACDNKVTFNNSENLHRIPSEHDDDRPPAGLHRLVTGQTKSFDDYSNPEPCGPQPFDVRTVPGQLSDDDLPVQRHVTGSRIGTRPIDNNSTFQSIDNNLAPLRRLPSLEQFQNQFEGHSRQVLHRDVEDYINHSNDSNKIDDSARGISDVDSYNTSIRNESQPELKEPVTVIKKSRAKMSDHEVFERTGPDGYMNEISPYLRSTTQNQMVKPTVDSQPDNSLKLSTSTQDSNEKFQEYDRLEKRAEKKHPPPPPGFHRMVEGNIGEEGVQKSRQPRIIKKNDERQRRHSIDSDSSVPLNNSVSEDCRKNIRRDPQLKKYNKSSERYHNRDRRNRHPRESEEDYFYEEEENASLSPDIEPEYRSHRSRNHLSKRFRQRIPLENYDHSDIDYQSEFDEFDEYDRRRRYRSPESERYRRHPKQYRDRRYQDEMSGHYYRKDDAGYRNRPSSRSDSDYLQDYTFYIETLDPVERRNVLLKFRENNPKAYTLWYTSYKTKVEMQKLISRTKNGSECSTPISTQSHDVGPLNHMVRPEKEKEIHRNTPPRYQKYHINAKMNMAFGQLFMLDSSNAKIDIFKVVPELDDHDTAELFRFSSPFVLGKTHKNAVTDYLNKLAEEALNNSERLLYELISMITKRNGIVHGTDVSEILMDNVAQVPADGVNCENMKDNMNISDEPFQNFRDLLLQGDKTKTLELAISNQDWGLAFMLASYMDSKTFNYVRFKYFQTIPQNDILQTFFQLSSGKIPSCTTCCSDSNWGDWRKHLAMILSNQHDNINIARSATIQLGDTLNAKGDVFGAHFCYLSIQVPLESVGLTSKLTLLGTSSNKPFDTLATNRAILLTSAYEFSMRLNINDFYIPSLLPYKYLLAIRLAEYGKCEQALHHLEAIATQVISSQPGSVNLGFVANVVELSTDLHYMQMSNNNLPGTIDVLDWLETLKYILSKSGDNYKPVDDTQVDYSQSHQVESAVVPNEQPTIPDSSVDYSASYQTPQTQVPLQVVQPPSLQNVQPQPLQVVQPSPLQVQQPPPSTANPYWQPNVVSLPTEPAPLHQNDHTQYYDPTSMIMPGEIINHNSPNEMTSEISTIAPDLTLMGGESEKTISTAPKFGFFDRQMAELEPKGPSVGENKSAKKDTDHKGSQKEKNSWLGGLTKKFWKPSGNHTDSIGEDFGNDMVQQAAPPMDSELTFNPVANSSPANQTQNQFKIQRKRGAKDMYVNVMSNSKPTESILAPDSIFQTSQPPNMYNPSQ